MAAEYPEEFVSYNLKHMPDSENQVLQVNLDGAQQLATTPAALRDINVRQKALDLKILLEDANANYYAQRYERALSGYREVAKQILALMEPSLDQQETPIEWPTGPQVTEMMAAATANLLSQLAPDAEHASLVISNEEHDISELLESTLKPQITHEENQEGELASIIDRANAAAIQGRWREATALYTEALDETRGPSQRADIFLNIGALRIQSNDTDEALGMLGEAEEMFDEVRDELGAIQAVHNKGLAYLKAGESEQAISTLESARERAGEVGLFGLLQSEDEEVSYRETDGPAPFDIVRSVSGPPIEVDADRYVANLGSHDLTLRLRAVQKGIALPNVKVETPVHKQKKSFERTFKYPVNGEVVDLTWSEEEQLHSSRLREVWSGRVEIEKLEDLSIELGTPVGIIVNLGHLYNLVIPTQMGSCHHYLGDYEKAETEYRRAAGYELINRPIEARDIWRKLANNVVAWGDSLYRRGDHEAAIPVYERLITSQETIPNSYLYQLDSLSATGTRVSEWLEAVVDGQELPDLNPTIVQALQTVRRRWKYLNAGFDFFGEQLEIIPPFTFAYLHKMASYFAQRGIQAEQRYIDYLERFEQDEMSRQQLENAIEQADLNVDAAEQEQKIATQITEAAEASEQLASRREQNAEQHLQQFKATEHERVRLAGLIARGNAFHSGDLPDVNYGEGDGWDFSNKKHIVLQRITKRQTEISNDLQIQRLESAVDEASAAVDVATQQKEIAEVKKEAADIGYTIAERRAWHTRTMYQAFEDQEFGPQQWLQMASWMKYFAEEALDRGTEIAHLMQRAYNFEQLDNRSTIRDSYVISSTSGTLGGDMLLNDIDSFTAYEISRVRHKPIPVKWSISLAQEYPGQFLEFTRSGRMEFDIDFERIRLAHPGTFRHQLREIKIEADGFLPPFGLHGRLTNSGIGNYRDEAGNSKTRIQPIETMILSRYDRHRDAIILSPPTEMRTLFEGNAVASGWTLEVPPSANDVDLNLVFDIRLVLYFECLYDQNLFTTDTQPQEDITFERSRALYLRNHFPDAYYQLRENGRAEIDLTKMDFPHNQTNPVLQSLSLASVPSESSSLEGTQFQVIYPSQPTSADVTLDEDGTVVSSELPVTGEPSALGNYVITIDETQLERKDSIEDLILVLNYHFTPAE